MSLRCLRRAVVAVALLAGAVAPAKADFVLDDFSSPNPGTLYTGPGTLGPTALGSGWSRTATVTLSAGPSSGVTGVIGTDPRTPSLGTVFELSTTAASTAYARLDYTVGSPVDWSVTGANVTGLTTAFTFADLSVPYSVVLTDSANNTLTYTGTITGAGTYSAPIGSFTGTGNLAAITGVSIYLNQNVVTGASTTSADFVIDDLTVNNTPSPVPAPPAALLALAALPVLGLRRAFRAKAA